MGLRDAVDPLALDARLLEHVAGAGGGKELDAHLLKAPGDAHNLLFVLVLDSDDDTAATLGRLQTGPLEGLQQGLREGLGQAQHLAGGLHLRAQAGVHVSELFKGENRGFDGVVVGFPVDAGAVLQVLQLLAQHHFSGQIDDGHAGDLGDIGDGTGGTGVGLDDIHRVVIDDELDVDEADDAQVLGQVAGVLEDGLLMNFVDVQGRIDGDGVAGVDTGTFHVFHDAGDEHVLPIEHAVHFHLSTHQVLVHQDGVFLHGHVDDLHEVNNVLILIGDLHALAAQDVGGTH